MALTVVDSDVLIDSLRGREPARSLVARELLSGSLATTSMNVFELLSGARTPKEANKVERLLAALHIFTLDEAAAREAARVRRDLERQGEPIGMADTLIAGVCLSRSARLLSRNRSHFKRLTALDLVELPIDESR